MSVSISFPSSVSSTGTSPAIRPAAPRVRPHISSAGSSDTKTPDADGDSVSISLAAKSAHAAELAKSLKTSAPAPDAPVPPGLNPIVTASNADPVDTITRPLPVEINPQASTKQIGGQLNVLG